MTEIARIMTFGTSCNADIVRRLMGSCKSFKGMTFANALAQYRCAERNGWIKKGDGFLVVYWDYN